MATIYKRKQDKTKKRSYWYIGFTDHMGKRKTRKGFTDKGETERLAAKLEEESRLIQEGIILPSQAKHGKKKVILLTEHIKAFELHLKNRDTTEAHVKDTAQKIKRIVTDCQFQQIDDINAEAIENYLGLLRAEGIGKQTSNHYLRAIKQFTRWLVRSRKVSENPLTDIPMLNTQTDRRHARRALAPDEFPLLIEAAEQGKSVEGLSGADRSMMYMLSSWTGFRKAEIGSLVLSSFDLESDPPTVTIQADFSKRKRTDIQILHPNVVIQLKKWMSKKVIKEGELLFSISKKSGGIERKTSKMMRIDLEAARKKWLEESCSEKEQSKRENSDFLCYQDHQGRFADFHANRHTFITNLGRAGVSPKTAQTLARHSDIRLTMNVYSHTDVEEKTEAISRLSKLWECSGSVPMSENGIDTHKTSSEIKVGKSRADDNSSAEPAVVTGVSTGCHCVTQAAKNTPGGIRTHDLRIRNPTLYPAELRAQKCLNPLL